MAAAAETAAAAAGAAAAAAAAAAATATAVAVATVMVLEIIDVGVDLLLGDVDEEVADDETGDGPHRYRVCVVLAYLHIPPIP